MEFSLIHHATQPKSGVSKNLPLLLLLHGYGANEDDLFSLAPYLDERFLVISARAPIRLQSMSHAWFNLGFTPQGISVDPDEVEAARVLIRKFIDEIIERYGVDRNGVYLAGFSQGAMMALAVALTFPGTAAAVVAASGRVLPQTLEQITDIDGLIGLPVFIVHGTRDNVVPISHARATREYLEELPIVLEYKEYPIAHEISAESLDDITEWLSAQLDARESGEVMIH